MKRRVLVSACPLALMMALAPPALAVESRVTWDATAGSYLLANTVGEQDDTMASCSSGNVRRTSRRSRSTLRP
jgi:hypothetical protein